MISLRQVNKMFDGNAVVSDLSFEVGPGENFVLLGTSGCGKTTTLKMINRLVEASSGQVLVNGQSVTQQAPEQLRRGIGYVLQRNSLFPHYTVEQNILVVPGLLGWDKEKTNARIKELMAKLHLLPGHLSVYPNRLSGGEAQRVNLARALVADPPILLMDEPFSALDPITRAAIRKEFMELDELKRKTMVMVTHDVQEAFEMGHRICLMDKGKAMQVGTPAELLFKPANGFVRSFLSGAFMQLSLSVTRLQELWPYLEEEGNAHPSESSVLSSGGTVWQALQLVKDKNDKAARLTIQHEQSSELKHTSWQGLLSAFSRHQATK